MTASVRCEPYLNAQRIVTIKYIISVDVHVSLCFPPHPIQDSKIAAYSCYATYWVVTNNITRNWESGKGWFSISKAVSYKQAQESFHRHAITMSALYLCSLQCDYRNNTNAQLTRQKNEFNFLASLYSNFWHHLISKLNSSWRQMSTCILSYEDESGIFW